MNTTRIISFFGCKQMDLCVYLAAILENLHYRVLVVDNSKEQEIKLCIPKPEEPIKTVSYKNVDYEFLRPFSEVYDYDYVLVNMGEMPDLEWLEMSDYAIATLACTRYGLEVHREVLKDLNLPSFVVMRDFCPAFMQSRAMRPYLEFDNPLIKEKLILPLLEQDACMYALLQFIGYRNIKGISKAMLGVLLRILEEITGESKGEILEAFRRTKRGEFY